MTPNRVNTDDLNRALYAYVAKLPLREAVTFAAGVWGISFEEALDRLMRGKRSRDAGSKKGPARPDS